MGVGKNEASVCKTVLFFESRKKNRGIPTAISRWVFEQEKLEEKKVKSGIVEVT